MSVDLGNAVKLELDEVKSHMRVCNTNEDKLIKTYLGAAFSWAEHYLDRTIYGTQHALDTAISDEVVTSETGVKLNNSMVLAIYQVTAYLYENRESAVGFSMSEIPMDAKDLLEVNRRFGI